MQNSANMSFALCPLLSDGAIEALLTAGSDELKAIYLEKLVTGERYPLLRVVRHPGHWKVRKPELAYAGHAAPPRLVESLEEAHRDPAVALVDVALDDQHVHDREDARLLPVLRFHRAVIGE